MREKKRVLIALARQGEHITGMKRGDHPCADDTSTLQHPDWKQGRPMQPPGSGRPTKRLRAGLALPESRIVLNMDCMAEHASCKVLCLQLQRCAFGLCWVSDEELSCLEPGQT